MINNILSLIIFTPLLGAFFCLLFRRDITIKIVALLASGINLGLCLSLWKNFNFNINTMQFSEMYSWIPTVGINYQVGVDGMSLTLVFLTSLLTFLSVIYSFIINLRVKEYFFLFLLLQTGMQGVFLATDYFLFFLFWEVSLVPMYFLIGIWGGPRREYAAIKFFLYTLVGSLAMLLAILAIYFESGAKSFDMLEIAKQKPFADNLHLQIMCFLGFFLAFAIKVPLFPFHTWLPDAHVEAPTAGSVILAGVLLKMGGYGFLRISLPTFPQASQYFAPLILILALISIVYGAYVAMAQTDLKKMIANSSVNHMGYVMLGIAAACFVNAENAEGAQIALSGAVLQMFSHGIITGALFLLVGVIYERTHIRDINSYGGLSAKVPLFAGVLTVFSFGSLGLPSLAGFISEFLIFLGSFKVLGFVAGIGLIGVIITAAFFLLMIQRILLGPLNPKYENLPDMDKRELICLIPLLVLMIVVGLYPGPFLKIISASLPVMEGFLK